MNLQTGIPTAYANDPRVTANDDGSFTVVARGSTFDVSYYDDDTLGWCVLLGDNAAVNYTSADHAIGNLIGAPQS